jgi:hypothetical protein
MRRSAISSPPGARNLPDDPMTSSNIEPLAREMAENICRRSGMPEADIPGWVDLHWPCAAAMLEAGVMDETGEWVEDKDVRLGLEAYRERLLGPK